MIVTTNAMVKGFSGRFGKLVFKQIRGRTIVARRPSKPNKESQLQRDNRYKFKLAAQYAKAMMLNPEKKAYYWSKAKKLKLPNAYTAAITDYMRKVNVKEVNTKSFSGKEGSRIVVKAEKQDFSIAQVEVNVRSKDGTYLEKGIAHANNKHEWLCTTTSPHTEAAIIEIRITDTTRQTTVVQHVLT